VRAMAEVATAVTKGDLTRSIALDAQGEMAALKDTINEMIINLKETTRKNTEQDWLKTNVARFTNMVQGQRDLLAVAKLVITELAPLVNGQQGIFYINDSGEGEQPILKLLASYAYKERKTLANEFKLGEGLVGQCALEKERILISDVPDDYIKISSGLGEATPLSVIVLPVLFEGQVKAVIELASFHRFSEIHLNFLDQLTESLGIVLNTIAATMRTEELLKQSQALAEELQSQQEELTKTNKRLEQQAATLKASEELLKNQQEQLQQTNAELQEKARLLAEQKTEVERKNREVEQAKGALEEKAEQLALTSKYKSEFLANMSHELRTPLNNLLILANMLSENTEGNLAPKQVKYAETIHSSGTDLLALINDILDLSKIESGTVAVDPGEVRMADLHDYVVRNFKHVADDKGLEFNVTLDKNLSKTMFTDVKRLQQVLKNLLSNALKFTERGSVSLRIESAAEGWRPDHPVLSSASNVIAFSVQDTGIGIPLDKQKIIFESFQQADGTTSRKYGGTGLGLSISREIAQLLGGEIRLESQPGMGSTFTLYLPRTYVVASMAPKADGRSLGARTVSAEMDLIYTGQRPKPVTPPVEVEDDRENVKPGDQILLIVEDDSTFARILLDLARENGYKGLVAGRGELALAMARKFRPMAITLDIGLPDTGGWTVLDRMKHDPELRHIPVHVLSVDENRRKGLALGAASHLKKSGGKEIVSETFQHIQRSIEKRMRELLVVEKDEAERQKILQLIGNGDVHTTALGSASEALDAFRQKPFDCVVLDPSLPDMPPADFIRNLRESLGDRDLPVILYPPDGPEGAPAALHAPDNIVLRLADSVERLLDETTLYLHRAETNLPQPKRQMLEQVRQVDPVLAGRKVLIVDDDVRNIFALTSVLEQRHIEVLHAENGRAGIEMLMNTADIEAVLMDVMMPGMDGYETIRAIRSIEGFATLPIIAVTAKAMKGDREKCIESGASDYIPKPVDLEQLFSLLRVWLLESREFGAPRKKALTA
jgi:signal transduction histidine kinase/CheY-like chemotaxis protein